jgi:hypothetical protein
MEKKNLIQEVSTRWNSTYEMIIRFLKLLDPVNSIINKTPHSSSYDKLLAINLKNALLQEITKRLSSAEQVHIIHSFVF